MALDGVFMDIDQENLDGQPVVPEVTDLPEQTMAETMAAKLSEIKSRHAETNEEAEGTGLRLRDPDGKFAARNKNAGVQAEPKAEPPVVAVPGTNVDVGNAAPNQDAVPGVAGGAAITAPSSYTPEAKAEFAKASPVIQREILKRESDFHKGVEHYKQAATYAQGMYNAIKPYEQRINSYGVTPEAAIQSMFEVDRKLSSGTPQERLQAFADLAKNYGIDLSQGLPQQQEPDPNMQYFQSQFQQTQQELLKAKEEIQKLAEVHAQREQSELNSMIEQAKQGKPHFDELRLEIGTILQSAINKGAPITIDQAYEAALWQSPTHRQELLAKQLADREAEAAKKRAEDAEKAKAARLASSVNVAKRGTLAAQKPVGNVQDIMREKLAEIRSR
jgi:hypothetical protein